MRVFILTLLLCYGAHADIVTNDNPEVFESAADLHKWATSIAGASKTELTYKKHKLVVYFRFYTSGVSTSEPFVFMEQDGRWVRVLTALTCRREMEATIEDDALVLWRRDWSERLGWSDEKKEKTEYLRFNLKTLDADSGLSEPGLLRGSTHMTTTRLLMTFAALVAIYSLLLFVSYRPLTRPKGVRLSKSTPPIETTTAEQQSRGESSFVVQKERRFGIERKGFFMLATFGYIALCVAFAIAFYYYFTLKPRMKPPAIHVSLRRLPSGRGGSPDYCRILFPSGESLHKQMLPTTV